MMLRLLSLITICFMRVKSPEVCDDKYYLTTSETTESVVSFEEAQEKCSNSWLLEIYDEKVVELLKKLNLDNQRILLGMTRNRNDWMWSDGTKSEIDVQLQTGISDEVACITNKNGKVAYISRKMFDVAGAICSKTAQEGNCTGWIHNGMCYFKLSSFYYTWFQAHNECIKYGAILAIFVNLETDFNMSFIDSQLYWVSLSRFTWMWMHSGAETNKVVTFNKWAVGNPYPLQDSYSNPSCATTDSSGNEWTSVGCYAQFHIVCMGDSYPGKPGCTQQATNSTTASVSPNIYHDLSTQPSLPKPGGSTNFPEPTNAEPLSIGTKAGIGVGVSMLLIIIIIIVGVLGFKNFHHCERNFGRNNSRKPLEPENHYAEIVPGNNYTASTDNNPKPINYADLDLQSRGTLANDD